MTAPISIRHRQAFIEVLAETGNYTLAAQQVRVSRDWAVKLKRRDKEFDAACREAVERARERLALRDAASPGSSPGEAAPQDERKWLKPPLPNPTPAAGRGANGPEFVVERGNGRVVQLKRSAGTRWTEEKEQRFLAALAGSCNVKLSAAEVGMSAPSAYKRRRNDPGFARAWEQAIEIGKCELQSQILQNVGHFFDRELPEPEAPMREVSVMDAIRLVRMYEKRERERRRGR